MFVFIEDIGFMSKVPKDKEVDGKDKQSTPQQKGIVSSWVCSEGT